MRIKRLSFAMLLAMATTLSFTSCSDDSLVGDGGAGSGASSEGRTVFLNAAVALPSNANTRSQTDEDDGETNSDGGYNKGGSEEKAGDDYEFGYDYENDVRTMLLVITDKNDKYITHTIVNGITQAPISKSPFDFIVNAEIKHEALRHAYEDEDGLLKESKDVRIYAFCNYTDRLLKLFNGEITETVEGEEKNIKPEGNNWLDWSGSVFEDASPVGHTPVISNTIWAPRSFLMTNAKVFDAEFPERIEDWDEYADKSNPYDLSATGKGQGENPDAPIKVERAAARIDFRDASETFEIKEDGTKGDRLPNTYALTIVAKQNTTSTDKPEPQPQPVANIGDDIYAPFNVTLTRMALVNMSNSFYYLRRVSNNGFMDETTTDADGKEVSNGLKYLGVETTKNYVVDTDADVKGKNVTDGEDGITPLNANDYFNFALFEDKKGKDGYYNYYPKGWYADKISTVLEGKEDTWSSGTIFAKENPYKIWRYVTENTIPSIPQQKNVQSVGVVFKGSIKLGADAEVVFPEFKDDQDIKPEDDSKHYVSQAVRDALKEAEKGLNANPENLPTLYMFENLLYASVGELVKGAIHEGVGSTLWGAVNTVLSNWKLDESSNTFVYNGTGETELDALACDYILNTEADKKTAEDEYYGFKIDFAEVDSEGKLTESALENLEKFRTTAPKDNITVYKATNEEDGEGWGYYCYYFYWNRHNDNLRSGRMGQMEFATVRNNVYKLGVTSISRFGHPTIPGYDPDPVEPEDPDEDELDYIQVRVEVLPWVVRVNNIEF